jgi:hypothetical protein
MKREEVYKLIDGERDYQDNRWNNFPETRDVLDEDKSVADWIIYMEKLLNDAKNRIYYLDDNGALEFIRKTTATGVACLEYNDCSPRKIE